MAFPCKLNPGALPLGGTLLSILGLSDYSLLNGVKAGNDVSRYLREGTTCEHPRTLWVAIEGENCEVHKYCNLISILRRKTRDTGVKFNFLISWKKFWVKYEGDEVFLEHIGKSVCSEGRWVCASGR